MQTIVEWYGNPSKDQDFSMDKIKQIKNQDCCINKPDGGLWTSPIISSYNWKKWCESEIPHWLGKHYLMEIDTSNFLIVDSFNACMQIPTIQMETFVVFDFEKISKKFDGVWVTPFPDWRFTKINEVKNAFYSWDCESVVVFNKQTIKNVFHDNYFTQQKLKSIEILLKNYHDTLILNAQRIEPQILRTMTEKISNTLNIIHSKQ